MTSHCQTTICSDHLSPALPLQRLVGTFKKALRWARDARAVSVQRRRLATLSHEALHDLGISREDAMREAARPFWDHA